MEKHQEVDHAEIERQLKMGCRMTVLEVDIVDPGTNRLTCAQWMPDHIDYAKPVPRAFEHIPAALYHARFVTEHSKELPVLLISAESARAGRIILRRGLVVRRAEFAPPQAQQLAA